MELKVNKILTYLLCCFCLISCSESQQNKKNDESEVVKLDSIQLDNNDNPKHEKDTVKVDTVNISNKNDEIKLPDFFDYESEYQLRYEFYIDKAYDKNTYKKHYQPYTYQSKYLDSLINVYEKKRETEDDDTE